MNNYHIKEIFTKIDAEWTEDGNTLMNSQGEYLCNLLRQKGYIFTSKELKQLLEDYTNRIVENVRMYDTNDIENPELDEAGNAYEDYRVDKESITSQLPKFLKEIGI